MGRILELKGLCDARECAIFGVCCNIFAPKEVPAVLIKGGLYKLSDLLNDSNFLDKFPEVTRFGQGTFIRAVEEVHGVEPIGVGDDLLFASTRPAKLEILFAEVDVEYVPNGGVYVRRIHKRRFKEYVNLAPLNQGLVSLLPRLLEARVPVIEIKPPNELYISDFYTSMKLIFGDDGKVKSKSGKVPLTWFSNKGEPLRELLQNIA